MLIKSSLCLSFSHVLLFASPWTVAHQAPFSMEFSRQEYWSWLSISSPEDHSGPGIKPMSPALQADSFWATREAPNQAYLYPFTFLYFYEFYVCLLDLSIAKSVIFTSHSTVVPFRKCWSTNITWCILRLWVAIKVTMLFFQGVKHFVCKGW